MRSGFVRVVSLLPSVNETFHYIGSGDELVGATHECDYPGGVEILARILRPEASPGAPRR